MKSRVFFSCLVASSAVAILLAGCSVEPATAPLVEPEAAASEERPQPPADNQGGEKPEKDAEPAENEPVPVPTEPFFELTIDGKAMKVKDVDVRVTNTYPSQGISYYEIEATLEQTPPIVPGQEDEPLVVIRVGKDEKGSDVCKEKRGPRDGFIEPVVELREVQIKYRRFTGSETVSAFPSTNTAGACTMRLETAATDGQAWGEAKGTLQATDEPALSFEAKWFQTVAWAK